MDDDGAHIHFEPIVQVPSDNEHNMGEEEEEVMYTQRAKSATASMINSGRSSALVTSNCYVSPLRAHAS